MGVREKLSTALAAARGDSAARYLFAERVARATHPDAILSDVQRSWMRDDDFESDYRRFHRPSFRRTMNRVDLLDRPAVPASKLPDEVLRAVCSRDCRPT